MTRWISVGLLTLCLGVAGSASAEPRPSPFPLAEGNRWTLRDIETNAARAIAVRGGPEGLVLSGLPGAPSMRVRWLGDTVQAWDAGDRRWEALFRFGVPVGERYLVKLGATSLWRGVVVTVASKRAAVEDFNGRTRRGCTRFTFTAKRPLADAGLESFAFAPGVGPIQVVEQTIAGSRELALASHRVK
jgi:hypothetical protein